MGRQYRPPRSGGSPSVSGGSALQFVGPAVVTSSSVLTVIPNYGVTDISTWAAGDYVLDAPSSGVEKTIICASSSSTAKVILMSTAQPGTIKINGDGTAHTRITFNATVGQCVSLVGQNSTSWIVRSMHPPTAVNSTGIVTATS